MSLFRRNYTERGAAPGVVVSPESPFAPQIHRIAFGEHGFEENTYLSAEAVPEIVPGKGVTWIDVRGLGDGSIVQEFGRRLNLHSLAVSDVTNIGQRPKVEQYEGVLFVVLWMVTLDQNDDLRWEQVSLFLGADFVLTFQETHDDCIEPLRKRIRNGRGPLHDHGADFLACTVIDAVVDGYFPVLEHYGGVLEELEDRILAGRGQDVLGELYQTKRDLAGFRRATWPLREALAQLMRDEDSRLSHSSRLHLRDTLDHTMQVVEVNESYRELSASLVDVYLSMVGQRTNDIMRVLTVVSTIFIPLTFLAGVYGMNFDTSEPLNLPELGWPLGYVLFWIVCLVSTVGLMVLFRRLGWLRR